MAEYKGAASEAGRAALILKDREKKKQEFEMQKEKIRKVCVGGREQVGGICWVVVSCDAGVPGAFGVVCVCDVFVWVGVCAAVLM